MHKRLTERAQLKRKLLAGVSIHMPAPRRIGKTWTIGRLADDLRADGWIVITQDVQGMSTPTAFARDLCQRIEAQNSIKDRFLAHAGQRLKNVLGGDWGSTPLDALGKVDPIEFAETLIAALDATDEKVAIIIDEISYFFLELAQRDAAAAKAFAYQLRALQQRYQSVRWLITGSIGLDTIARRYGLEGAFVDFEVFVLDAFTPAEALSYLRDPAIQQQFNQLFDADDADFHAMFARLGWLAPFYLKLVANEVRPSIPGTGGALPRATAADLDAAFDRLLQPNRRAEFAVWREHVQKNLPVQDRAIAMQLLDILSQNANGEQEATLLAQLAGVERRALRDILAMLINDGLLMLAGNRYRFRSGLVGQYWQAYEAA